MLGERLWDDCCDMDCGERAGILGSVVGWGGGARYLLQARVESDRLVMLKSKRAMAKLKTDFKTTRKRTMIRLEFRSSRVSFAANGLPRRVDSLPSSSLTLSRPNCPKRR